MRACAHSCGLQIRSVARGIRDEKSLDLKAVSLAAAPAEGAVTGYLKKKGGL